ncbi:hypothetical protein FXN63_16570 [Pigmentiphaga aceris]|uniref:Uncharacterized protein n=1 Tax=Pigmentiphaga aceris TaxID=1940612 RepID=A0A5C0B276_9BURK|nr:hypothetical protein [Pigmentiphaga aceris]QEI07280.1 hypothetical protein FXN63_16570 [Pigmentiphaga aceris]
MPEHTLLAQLDVGSPAWEARRKLERALDEHRRKIDEYHHFNATVSLGMTLAVAVGVGLFAAWAIRKQRSP